MSEESCYHCGEEIHGRPVKVQDKSFCCHGCATVYQLLSENNLNSFYEMEPGAGVKPKDANDHKYAFLDVPEIREKYITFENDSSVHLTLFLPSIHCSSCIYLLENIQKIEPKVMSCNVNFVRKTASIVLSKDLPLSDFAHLLDSIGYPPNFGDRKSLDKKRNFQYLYKLGVAGFAFGSIMLWTFPEYVGIERDNPEIRTFTAYLSLIVSIPVLVYSASDYLKSAYKALRYRSLNLDVPISIGIIALYSQSVYTILSNQGTGYMDSFAGFVFFLLIGKWFQSKTYESLSFERDYTAYFPVAVTKISGNEESIITIENIEVGDLIKLRNEEIVPCDSRLQTDSVQIDYSFVTGESDPVHLKKGDFVYAGGKVLGTPGVFRCEKESSRSQLTQMWNESNKNEAEEKTDMLSVYFLSGLLILAVLTAVLWTILDPSRALANVVAVLIVACPCALALSKPFTFGNITRLLGRSGLYMKDATSIQTLNETTDIVFDKTGTLTSNVEREVIFEGTALTPEEKQWVVTMTGASSHPLSRAIHAALKQSPAESPDTFTEHFGKGIDGTTSGHSIQMGSGNFVGAESNAIETEVHLKIDGSYRGKFVLGSSFRADIFDTLKTLAKRYNVYVVSGDSEKDAETLKSNVPELSGVYFRQSPQDKKEFIESLRNSGKNVLMIGDGLNDAGALKTADSGIAISEDIFRFTPGSDAIIDANALSKLPKLLDAARFAKTVLLICYIFSVIYNAIGLTFAISGELTPLVAAILMPISSITIVFISTAATMFKRF